MQKPAIIAGFCLAEALSHYPLAIYGVFDSRDTLPRLAAKRFFDDEGISSAQAHE